MSSQVPSVGVPGLRALVTRLRPALLAATILGFTSRAAPQCQYEVVQLDYPIECSLDNPVVTIGSALNSQGVVVGRYKCPIWTHTEAFVWSAAEGFATLPRPSGIWSSLASDISDSNVIVGTYQRSGIGNRGFVYHDGQYTELLPLRGPYSWANGISDDGAIVVGARTIRDTTAPYNAFIWTAEEGFTDLGVINGPSSSAWDVGQFGEVVGCTGNCMSISEGFIWHDGQFTVIGPIPGGATSLVNTIGPDQMLVGSGRTESFGPDVVILGFVWHDGEFTLIEPLPGYDTSSVLGVNSARQITGVFTAHHSSASLGYLRQHGVTYDLNDLVSGGTPLIRAAGSINDSGQILVLSGLSTLLLTPVGRPPGDLDIDCAVGVTDLLMLLAAWGPCPAGGDCPADLDGNGLVGYEDFTMLLGNWS